MKLFDDDTVLYSQRMDYIESHDEWRDSIDQRVVETIEELGGISIGMPNVSSNHELYIERIAPKFIFLTGGNTVSSVWYRKEGVKENTYRRDLTEYALLDYAISHKIPVIGICRGFQFINVYFNGSLKNINSHVGVRHEVTICSNDLIYKKYQVNSYHNEGIGTKDLANSLIPFAITSDGYVEAFKHETYNIIGVQWHPEREKELSSLDKDIFKLWIKGGKL